jgi:hypothetical protein
MWAKLMVLGKNERKSSAIQMPVVNNIQKSRLAAGFSHL